jgi:dihydrolipoamide dehydrogenase
VATRSCRLGSFSLAAGLFWQVGRLFGERVMQEIHTEVAIIGAGSAGMYALREVKRAGKSFILIDQGPLGTTCARVGCMPSKVALHAAHLWDSRRHFSGIGIEGVAHLHIDTTQTWAALREQRDRFASGPSNKAREAAGERLLMGRARFIGPKTLEVESSSGQIARVYAHSVVIAVGSRPVRPAVLTALGHAVLTTDDFFEQTALPRSLGVLGLGAIGLEMGLAASRLGVAVIGADLADVPAGIADPDVARRAIDVLGREFPLWLGRTAQLDAVPEGVRIRSGEQEAVVERVLVAIGRRSNLDRLDLTAAGIALDARGMPEFDPATMQIAGQRIFIAGDANGDRPLMHEAADEGAIAGYNASRAETTRFARRVSLGIAFTSPDIVSVGARYDQLNPEAVVIGMAEGAGNGRSRIVHGENSLIRIYADARSGRLLGASLFAIGGEHLAHLLAWAIQRGETVGALLQLPFYHPVLEEMLQSALQSMAAKLPASGPLPGLVVAQD